MGGGGVCRRQTWFLVYRQSGLNLPKSLVQERRQGLDARQATRLTGLDQSRSQRVVQICMYAF